MKKTLSTILLGASLFLGAGNKTKAQVSEPNIFYDFINNDEDNFSEEVYGIRNEDMNKTGNNYLTNKMGLTIIYYKDKDNNNFHESIREINIDKLRRFVIEDFSIDKNMGLINYEYKIYLLAKKEWNKYFTNKPLLDIAKENNYDYLYLQTKKYSPNLTKEDIYKISSDFGDKVKRLINASKDEDALNSMLKEERYLWEAISVPK